MRKSDDIGHRKLRELEVIAERINENYRLAGSTDPDSRETYDAYKIVEKIVSSGSLSEAAKQFTSCAASHPVTLGVDVWREEKAFPEIKMPPGELISALALLWRAYFQREGWTRLKSCPMCHRWFVDLSSDKRKVRCSEKCTNEWWSYDRRKEAEYSRFKKGGYHGKAQRKKGGLKHGTKRRS